MSAELLTQLRLNGAVFGANTGDLNHDDTLRPPDPGGNCVGWVLGHVLSSRNAMLEAFGLEPVLDPGHAERFRRGAEPLADPADAISLEDIRTYFNAAQESLTQAVAELTAEKLSQPAPFSATGREDETMGTLIASLLFHESYHLGQIGVLRRVLGKPGVLT